MYKDYQTEDYLRVTGECKDRIRSLLQSRYDELEEERDAINDRYPYEDLYLKQEAVDNEEAIISHLLGRPDDFCDGLKAGISRDLTLPIHIPQMIKGMLRRHKTLWG